MGPSEIAELARSLIGRSRAVHVAPAIPGAKEAGARRAHAHLAKTEAIVALYDATLFGSAEEGFVLTTERLAWKNLLQHPRQVPWRELDPATVLALQDGVGVARGVVQTNAELVGGAVELFTALADRSAAPDAGPYRTAIDPAASSFARLVALARAHVGEVEHIYFHPAIPAAKLANARLVHGAELGLVDPIAVLYDDTLFESARDGFVLTPSRLAWKNLADEPATVEWSVIDPERVVASSAGVRVMGWELRVTAGPAFAARVASLVAAAAEEARKPS
jgi:hypothetical protein